MYWRWNFFFDWDEHTKINLSFVFAALTFFSFVCKMTYDKSLTCFTTSYYTRETNTYLIATTITHFDTCKMMNETSYERTCERLSVRMYLCSASSELYIFFPFGRMWGSVAITHRGATSTLNKQRNVFVCAHKQWSEQAITYNEPVIWHVNCLTMSNRPTGENVKYRPISRRYGNFIHLFQSNGIPTTTTTTVRSCLYDELCVVESSWKIQLLNDTKHWLNGVLNMI